MQFEKANIASAIFHYDLRTLIREQTQFAINIIESSTYLVHFHCLKLTMNEKTQCVIVSGLEPCN